MKKIVTLDSIMVSFISAMGYGFGYTIPSAFNLHPIICFLICMVLGTVCDNIANKIIFSKKVQQSNARRYIVFVCFALVFVLGYIYMARFFAYSLWNDVQTEMTFSVIIPIVFFFLSLIVEYIKRKKLLKKYGTGEDGFILDDKVEKQWIRDFGTNEEISDYSGKDPVVRTYGGAFIGKQDKQGVRFLGIPYAKAPCKKDRWKKPIPIDPSDKMYTAYYYGSSEIQPEGSHNILNRFKQDEDCLSLNIWTSKLEPNSSKPVLVYLHGGDGRYGGSANPINHLSNLSKGIPDSVCVSVNYRFGVFGAVSFDGTNSPDLNEYQDAPLLSLYDQIEALKWVKSNIANFGGDPDNITLIGDNAGGSCISMLSSMEETKGLFKRALIMCASSYDSPQSNKSATEVGKLLLEEFESDTISGLSQITSEQLKDFSGRHYDLLELPSRDGTHVPRNINAEYQKGICSDVEFIFAIATDDTSGWLAMLAGDVSFDDLTKYYYEMLMSEAGKDKADKLEKLLDKYKLTAKNDYEARKALLTDFFYKACILCDIKSLIKGGSKVRCIHWDVNGDIEKFNANSVSMVSTILGNFEMAEQLGYLNSKNITEITQTFIDKFIHGKDMALYKNEVKGVNEIIWDEFSESDERVLKITRDKIEVVNNEFSENVHELEKIILE